MINELKKNIKKKYSYSVYTENKVKKYFTLLKKILIKKNNISQISNKYSKTEKHLFYLMHKKKKNYKDVSDIIKFYKKFNVNLKLKKNYNFEFKSITKTNCHPRAYIFLGSIIAKSSKFKIYSSQKLNCFLKIVDISLINLKKLNSNEIEILKKLIKKTFYLIERY